MTVVAKERIKISLHTPLPRICGTTACLCRICWNFEAVTDAVWLMEPEFIVIKMLVHVCVTLPRFKNKRVIVAANPI